MGKVFKNKKCEICGKVGKVIETWGHMYCKKCWDKKPKKGDGHSGMIKQEGIFNQAFLPFPDELKLERCKKSNPYFATLYLNHYPKSKGIVGRQVNYLIKRNGILIGIIGANSPPLNFLKFRRFFNVKDELNFLNNNVYCLIVHEKNLGTKVLKLFRNKLKKDYYEKYGDKLIGLITFVEPPRTGAMYKADNWIYLGMTEGKHCSRSGSLGKWINKEWSIGTKKHIFVKRIY